MHYILWICLKTMPLIYILSIDFPCYRMVTARLMYIYKVQSLKCLDFSAFSQI